MGAGGAGEARGRCLGGSADFRKGDPMTKSPGEVPGAAFLGVVFSPEGFMGGVVVIRWFWVYRRGCSRLGVVGWVPPVNWGGGALLAGSRFSLFW